MIGLRRWLAFQVLGVRTPAPRRRPRRGPERSPDYRNWVRTFPCAACGIAYGIEAAHTGPHGVSQKSSDRGCIPLCGGCHRTGPNALHRLGPVNFQSTWKIDIPVIVAELNRQWRQR